MGGGEGEGGRTTNADTPPLIRRYGGFGTGSVQTPGYSVFSDETASLYDGDDLEVDGDSGGTNLRSRGGGGEAASGGGGGGHARMTGYLERFTGEGQPKVNVKAQVKEYASHSSHLNSSGRGGA